MNSTETLPETWTDRPAPYLESLYSVQAVAEDPTVPDVTVYRRAVGDAKNWMESMANGFGGYKAYLLRRAEKEFDVYDSSGNLITKKVANPFDTPPQEVQEYLSIDRESIEEEAREALYNEGLSMLVCHAGHVGASAADHSNFTVVCHRMIRDASKRDIDHFYLVESKKHPCRVAAIMGDMSRVSPELQDNYLDRWEWLEKSWPLLTEQHRSTLAARLAHARGGYVSAVITQCAEAAGWEHHQIMALTSAWACGSPGARYRFCQHLVHQLCEGLVAAPHEAEMFTSDIIEKKGRAAVEDYQSTLR